MPLRGKLQKAVADHLAETVGIKLGAGRTDDPCAFGHLADGETVEQTGQDLAPGKIAGRAENDAEA